MRFRAEQKAAKKIKPPLPLRAQFELTKPAFKNEIEKILFENSPQGFAWKLVVAGRVPGGTLFKEYVELRQMNKFTEFSIRARIKSERTTDALDMKKDANIEDFLIKYELTIKDYAARVDRDVLILTNEKTNEVERLKIFLDRNRKKILKLQNTKNKMIYVPAEVEYPTPVIVLTK